MIYKEVYDYLYSTLTNGNDARATLRVKDYQQRRLRRALLARSIKPCFLEASWAVTTGAAGQVNLALTQPFTKPLIVIDGAIRTSAPITVVLPAIGTQADRNNFELELVRATGNSRAQITQGFVKDEHLLTPAQAAIRPFNDATQTLGQGAPNPLTWPVPLRLLPNEILQVRSRILAGGMPADGRTFCQFRAVSIEDKTEDDSLIAELREHIRIHPIQKPYFLSMTSENSKSITFPATGALQRTQAKTGEAPEHLLVIGYAALFGRSVGVLADGMSELGSACSPKWRLESSDGHAFSREEIDVNTYAYAGPGFFWQEFPQPFLLRKGGSLSASFSTLDAIVGALEQLDNYIFFRCVTV